MTYDLLSERPLPRDVEIVDGGLAGLNLLRFVEDAERVVFVDAVAGFSPVGGIVILDMDEAARRADGEFDHGAGLSYLLRMLPHVVVGRVPEIFLVGIEGVPDKDIIARAAETSVMLAVNGVLPAISECLGVAS